MKLIAPFLIIMLAGCVRISDGQAEQLSQARANVQAIALIPASDADAHSRLYQAVSLRVMSATADMDLPAPAKSPASLASVPAQMSELTDAQAASNNPPGSVLSTFSVVAGGIGLAVIGILRFSPGVFGAVADLAHTLLAPKATKDQRIIEQDSYAIAQQSVAYGQALSATATAGGMGAQVEAIKDKYARAADQLGIHDQIDTLLAAAKAGKLAPIEIPPVAIIKKEEACAV